MTIHIPVGDASYDIILGPGVLASAPGLLAERCPASQYVVITDSTVAPLYGHQLTSALGAEVTATLVTFPAGEWNKNRETWSALTDQVLAAGIGRDGAVVALGGGVVGDVAGFVAATVLRGIPYVQVPTTLLAMIDSSIGGKTGVDTAHGKNLVGAFHQPRAVIADVSTLKTLPAIHRSAGMSEALKHGFIADALYVDSLVRDRDRIMDAEPAALVEAVRRSVEIKASVVADDERELGRRAILNFGHTVGHAIETVCGYEILHGEAVALGMIVETELGKQLGFTEASTATLVREAIEVFGLPTKITVDASADQLLDVMAHDKKVRDGSVRFALPRRPGEMARGNAGEWTVTAERSLIRDMFGRLGLTTNQ